VSPTIRSTDPIAPATREAIIEPPLAHNQWHGLGLEGEEMAFALSDDDGAIAGGLLGFWRDGWLFVASLSVRDDLRGHGFGRGLVQQAIAWVRQRDGKGLWLDSYGFQAPDFYRHLGFREMGRLPDYLPGSDRIWFVLRFDRPSPSLD
jgi:GNAT superfamily N-acetyltransferase